MYCPNCGAEVSEKAVICVKCGVQLKSWGESRPPEFDPKRRDWLVTLLLCWFLGGLGIHRFYTGNTALGVAQLLTCGGCGVWWLIDFILILVDGYHDGNGQTLVKKN